MPKKLCKLTREEIDKMSAKKAKYLCRSCKQVSHKEKKLCKPKKIKKSLRDQYSNFSA